MSMSNNRHARPSAREWLRLAIGIAFVLCGLFLLPSNRAAGIVTLGVFGSSVLVFAIPICRKLRSRRPHARQVEIAGGVSIRPSRVVLAVAGAWLAGLGTMVAVFGGSYSIIMGACGVCIALPGFYLLFALTIGWLPNRYLRFDPAGITFGYRRWSYMVEWDNIAQVAAGEYSSNPIVGIHLQHPDLVAIQPPQHREQVYKRFAQNAMSCGAPIMLNPFQYQMDIHLLIQALERYIENPSARAELSRRRLPGD
jgi:hypothetical protein